MAARRRKRRLTDEQRGDGKKLSWLRITHAEGPVVRLEHSALKVMHILRG
jgi:hypothetical protein